MTGGRSTGHATVTAGVEATPAVPWPAIHKTTWPGTARPNVLGYDAVRASFSWDEARRELDGLPAGCRVHRGPAHTRSGKILRRLLKARELGLPEGDLSTLEVR